MNKIYIGKVVSTHGIKGEIRILSDFPYKEKAFQINTSIIIDEKNYKIKSYRRHKNYDMITLEGYCDINDILFLLKKEVYKEREELHLEKEEILDSDILEYEVLTEEGTKGKVTEVFLASPTNKVLRIQIEKREILLPYKQPFVKEIDYDKKQIYIMIIEGM